MNKYCITGANTPARGEGYRRCVVGLGCGGVEGGWGIDTSASGVLC